MTNKNKKNYLLNALIAIVLLSLWVIGALSFTLSFFAISSLALSLGVVQEVWLARMFGVIIDLLMMASMGAHLYHSFEGHFADRPAKDDYVGYAQFFISTNLTSLSMYGMAIVSVWFNAIHSGKYDIPSVVMSALPAIAMLVVTELVAGIIRTWVKSGDLATGIDSLRSTLSKLEGDRDEIISELGRIKEEVAKETLALDNLQSQQAQYTTSLSNVEEVERRLVQLREEADRLASENKTARAAQIEELSELLKDKIQATIGVKVFGLTRQVTGDVVGKSDKTIGKYAEEGEAMFNGTIKKLQTMYELAKGKDK